MATMTNRQLDLIKSIIRDSITEKNDSIIKSNDLNKKAFDKVRSECADNIDTLNRLFIAKKEAIAFYDDFEKIARKNHIVIGHWSKGVDYRFSIESNCSDFISEIQNALLIEKNGISISNKDIEKQIMLNENKDLNELVKAVSKALGL